VETSRIFTVPTPPAITTAPDTLRITGGITTNEPCYDFSAAATQRDTIFVTLIAQRRTGFCQQVLAAFSYTIIVTGVQPGNFPLRLIHNWRAQYSVLETALDTMVQVP
jgi:hypothetical protein